VYGVNGSNHVEFEGVFLTGAELRDLFQPAIRDARASLRDARKAL
jgi:hypothetical protein